MVVATSKKPELGRYVGLNEEGGQATNVDPEALRRVIAVKLAAQGFVNQSANEGDELLDVASDLFRVYREQSRLLSEHRPPIDQRIQAFLNDALSTTGDKEIPQLPQQTLNVDRYGIARELSLPEGKETFFNEEISSYRLSNNGICHNPVNDKRTTKGVFHGESFLFYYYCIYFSLGIVLTLVPTTYTLKKLQSPTLACPFLLTRSRFPSLPTSVCSRPRSSLLRV